MRTPLFVLVIMFLVSCSHEEENTPKENDHINVVPDTSTSIDTSTVTLTNIIDDEPAAIDTFDIVDYYHYFFDTPLKEFKNLDYQEAFKNKAYVLNTFNVNKGFIAFTTQNTPPEWDGDSKTEWNYQITYWIQPNGDRIIALATTEYTWVSESSSVEFYLHSKEGIEQFSPLERSWNLGDFVSTDIQDEFPTSFFESPVVYIQLPENDRDIKIQLSYSDYEDDQELVDKLFDMELEYNAILINPIDGEIRKQ